jgi:hypothetical protein
MSDYHRTTRECSTSQLHPELLQAIRNYFLEKQLGDLEAETILCCETISEKKNVHRLVAWLNGTSDTTIHMGILLTSQWLIWARHGDTSGTILAAASLGNILVKTYTSILTQDTGLEISGYFENSKGPLKGHIGMESELVAQKFCDEIARLNPPKQKGWPKWMGR